jgi:hypothetical protein
MVVVAGNMYCEPKDAGTETDARASGCTYMEQRLGSVRVRATIAPSA